MDLKDILKDLTRVLHVDRFYGIPVEVRIEWNRKTYVTLKDDRGFLHEFYLKDIRVPTPGTFNKSKFNFNAKDIENADFWSKNHEFIQKFYKLVGEFVDIQYLSGSADQLKFDFEGNLEFKIYIGSREGHMITLKDKEKLNELLEDNKHVTNKRLLENL